jgi:hypothetical protein
MGYRGENRLIAPALELGLVCPASFDAAMPPALPNEISSAARARRGAKRCEPCICISLGKLRSAVEHVYLLVRYIPPEPDCWEGSDCTDTLTR